MARKLTLNDDKIILNVSKNFTRISFTLIILSLIIVAVFLQGIININISHDCDKFLLIIPVLIIFAIILPFFNFKREVIFYKNKLIINDKGVFKKTNYEGEISHLELFTDSHRAKLYISNVRLAFIASGVGHVYKNYFFSTIVKTKDNISVTIYSNTLEIRKLARPGMYQKPPETEDIKLNNILNFFSLPVKIDFGMITINEVTN